MPTIDQTQNFEKNNYTDTQICLFTIYKCKYTSVYIHTYIKHLSKQYNDTSFNEYAVDVN